jgi:hypothetical protein
MHSSLKLVIAATLAFAADSAAQTAPDKYSLKVPGGLAFAEFKGYESWEAISLSEGHGSVAIIVGNPTMIAAYRAGIPANGKPVPDGAKMAKIHWAPQKSETAPGPTTIAGNQQDVDFMVKDSKRFADSAGWGFAAFEIDAKAPAGFRPANMSDKPPQAQDAKCGLACHARVKTRDYVFTEYAKR